MMAAPEMNTCSKGIAVDAKGRAWVVTMARQLRKEEEVQTSMMMTDVAGGGTSASVKTEGNTDLRTTDAFKLEIFYPDGVLLGEHPADPLRQRHQHLGRQPLPHRPRARRHGLSVQDRGKNGDGRIGQGDRERE